MVQSRNWLISSYHIVCFEKPLSEKWDVRPISVRLYLWDTGQSLCTVFSTLVVRMTVGPRWFKQGPKRHIIQSLICAISLDLMTAGYRAIKLPILLLFSTILISMYVYTYKPNSCYLWVFMSNSIVCELHKVFWYKHKWNYMKYKIFLSRLNGFSCSGQLLPHYSPKEWRDALFFWICTKLTLTILS